MRIVLVLILGAVALAAFSVFNDKRRLAGSAKALGLDAPGVRLIDCPGPMLRFALKPEEGVVYVVNDLKASPVRLRLEDIAGCEFTDGGEKGFGLGSALVGEAAASALSGRNGGSVLRILLKDADRRPVEYRLTRSTYQEDFRIFAREVRALLEEFGEPSAL